MSEQEQTHAPLLKVGLFVGSYVHGFAAALAGWLGAGGFMWFAIVACGAAFVGGCIVSVNASMINDSEAEHRRKVELEKLEIEKTRARDAENASFARKYAR